MVNDEYNDLRKWLIFLLIISICVLSLFSVIKLTPEGHKPPNYPCLFPILGEEGVALDVCSYTPCSHECDRKFDDCLSYTKDGIILHRLCAVNHSKCLKQCSSKYTRTIELTEWEMKTWLYESKMEKEKQLFEEGDANPCVPSLCPCYDMCYREHTRCIACGGGGDFHYLCGINQSVCIGLCHLKCEWGVV